MSKMCFLASRRPAETRKTGWRVCGAVFDPGSARRPDPDDLASGPRDGFPPSMLRKLSLDSLTDLPHPLHDRIVRRLPRAGSGSPPIASGPAAGASPAALCTPTGAGPSRRSSGNAYGVFETVSRNPNESTLFSGTRARLAIWHLPVSSGSCICLQPFAGFSIAMALDMALDATGSEDDFLRAS